MKDSIYTIVLIISAIVISILLLIVGLVEVIEEKRNT